MAIHIDLIEEIRAALRRGERPSHIATRLGISKTTVWRYGVQLGKQDEKKERETDARD
jgi:DNA invertase Pin-like site-specific DNA recombinase